MNIQERINALIVAFNGLSNIPNESFILACTGCINGSNNIWNSDKKVWQKNVSKIISEYWSQVYDCLLYTSDAADE